ncbi:GH1 family beta-glucosidase [Streptomyces himalayensis]|uniref:Beta-glucosidase n=1 Tax=Streptomyces himalayensis subsp. himalayensis TaxID=2756131 RepID=A0A7W0DL68_9ACTN|nr:GH1 family beta-glucosidase [Streptomyces himalayensis]MBA2946990.1 beta-glucosidase [Streptomyces himalayensis subsp. himalayensis]
MPDLSALPPDFLWGVATSAYQIEGAVDADGRLPSIWDTFCARPGAIENGDTGDVACDSYRRRPEDLALLKELGAGSYRFSVAWPRVVPTGSGPVNRAGIAHYDRLVDDLLAAGIRPFVTLYHWDLPQALQEKGGWPHRDTARHFADYAAVVAEALGDRVTDWVTLNEPLCSAWIGHLEGTMAPGITDLGQAVRASYHLLLAHGLGVQAIRAHASAAPSIGLVTNLSPCEPATDRPQDVLAAQHADGHINRWWLDPVHGRGFPADMRELYGTELPEHPGDLDVIASPTDFLGLNYYFRMVVEADTGVPGFRQLAVPGATTTDMGWEVHPGGLTDLLLRLTKDYGVQRLYVTENGSAWPDRPGPGATVDDAERTAFLEDHLRACAHAVAQGAPLQGYFAWSLMDNFEWAYGYRPRFGLAHVDYPTQTRTLKRSGRRYAELIAAHTTGRPATRS